MNLFLFNLGLFVITGGGSLLMAKWAVQFFVRKEKLEGLSTAFIAIVLAFCTEHFFSTAFRAGVGVFFNFFKD